MHPSAKDRSEGGGRLASRLATLAIVLLGVGVLAVGCATGTDDATVVPEPRDPDGFRVLVFTRTEGFRHGSIEVAVDALSAELGARGHGVVATEDPGHFSVDRLEGFSVVVFLNTTGDVLDDAQERALQTWVQGGGGWVGVHAALDTEYGWDFYGTLAGARFASHPEVQSATVRVEDTDHPAMVGVPDPWSRVDEWYDLRANPRNAVHVLAAVDESTYDGGQMGDHPIVWCRHVGSGTAFVTALGHTDESWADPVFLAHVAGGIESVTVPSSCP